MVSPTLWTVLVAALDAADESGGIYDPTVLRSLEHAGYDRSFEAIEPIGPEELNARRRRHSTPGDVFGWTTPRVRSICRAISRWIWEASRKVGPSITSRSRSLRSVRCSWTPAEICGSWGLLMVSHGRSACRSPSGRNATAPLCDCAAVHSRRAVPADAGGSAETGCCIT